MADVNTLTIEEIEAAAAADEILEINTETRVIDVPVNYEFGVFNDKDVKTIYFKVPKTYNAVDLNDFQIRMVYMNASNEGNEYIVTNRLVYGSYLYFTWLLGRDLFKGEGSVRFIVCMRKFNSDGTTNKEFNTTIARGTVLGGLEVDDPTAEKYNLVAEINSVEALLECEAIQAAIEAKAEEADATYERMQELSATFGSPLVAATAAEMTNGSRVYVYVGNETGYTAGHWYYSDGSKWNDGGVYQSAGVALDTTLSVAGKAADAKAAGDAITAEQIARMNADTALQTAINNEATARTNAVDDVKSDLSDTHEEILNVAYKSSGNLLDFGVLEGTWKQGDVGNSNPYMCNCSIPVRPNTTLYGVVNGDKMRMTSSLASYTLTMYCLVFDGDGIQIGSSKNMSNSASQLTNYIDIPADGATVKVVLSSGSWGNQFTPSTLDNAVEAFAYLGYDENITAAQVSANYTPYGAYNEQQINEVKSETDLIDYALVYDVDDEIQLTELQGIISSAGVISTASGFSHCIVDVSPGEHYKVTTRELSNTTYPFLLYYNSSDVIIGNVPSGNDGYNTKEIVIPDGVAKICVNGVNVAPYNTHVYTMVIVPVKNYIDDSVSENPWKNKKIVWFGTSIPAGVVNAGAVNGNGAYPTRIGEMLGATVYNESIGSSRVRGGDYHSISADDPMGWAGMEAVGVMLSMSLSRSEKQEIIDNWDTKWKNIMQDPSSYNPADTANYLNSSWDTILTKYLSGGSVGQCDLYVFDHGYNEAVASYGFSNLSEVPAQQNDRTYFFGAMNYLVNKILSDNPKAKIIIIGHYNYGADPSGRAANWSGKFVCDAQKAYAQAWGFSCIETWKLLGLSMNNITVNNASTPVIYARYPDHIHPASDTSGYELKRYAEALEPYLKLACST